MPRGIPGSGPFAGRAKKTTKSAGRGRRSTTLAEVAARSGGNQTASGGQNRSGATTTATGRGRGGKGSGGKGRATAAKTSRARGATGSNGQQRGETEMKTPITGNNGGAAELNGIKIDVLPVPGRGGRPQQAEKYPFASLDVAEKQGDGSIVGPSFLIPEADQPDNILAAARKRHKGMTFMSRKMEGGVRIWRAK